MSQTRSADAAPAEALAARRTSSPAPTPRSSWVAWFIALAALPVALALALIGLRVNSAVRSADAYGQVAQLSALDQQVTGLARAMADERSSAAAFISAGRPAAGVPALQRQYAITDGLAAKVRRLVPQLDHGYPAQTRADAAQVLASIDKLPGLRRQTAQSQASANAVITGYSAATAGLFPVNNGIADKSGNPTLISSAAALGSLSRMIDHASQQQAILGAALAEGRFGPGALTALTTARAQQAGDLVSFRNSATAQESWALTQTLARPPARQAQAVEKRAIKAGNGALALGPHASQRWSSGMSYTVGWMGQAEQQLAGWIPAEAKTLQRSEMRSAMLTGGVAVGALALILLGTIPAARSMARRRRRPEAPALENARAPLPISPSAVSADYQAPRPAEPLALVDVLGAAASEVADHGRVFLDVQQGVYLSGSAAADTEHLLTELLENAVMFSPETAEVIVSGHAVYGGGSLVTITDGGTGMSEEELTQLNWQLANPSLADMTVARNMGLFTVAHLAARHGIMVTLSMPPDGGTTAEVYLPDALISLDAEPDGWRPQADEAPLAGISEQAEAREESGPTHGAGPTNGARASKQVSPELAGLLFPARRFASGPERPLDAETETRETVPALLGAPLPAPAREIPTGMTEPDTVSAEPVDGAPIFESVRSGYFHAFGRDPLRLSEQQAGKSPTGQPPRPPAPWGNGNGNRNGNGNGHVVAGPPTAGRPALAGLPQHLPPSGPVRGVPVDQKTWQASAAK